MDTTEGSASASVPGRRGRAWLVAGAASVAILLAGFGVAAAQTADPPPPAPGTAAAPPAPPGQPNAPAGKHRPRGMGKLGMGGIHGEMTTRAPGGGYQVLASQVGEVKDVTATSITVQSEDGFKRTYVVDDGTIVKAGNNGIADVKSGDTVRVIAVVKDGTATAKQVGDVTKVRESRGTWAPPRKA